ncbi:hypothetical protein B0H13DRAFT_2672103 [Mycena leptocephala]|nr:hypothetical protein B0H13DRAFT_2672103 [Mycena leptocephala]
MGGKAVSRSESRDSMDVDVTYLTTQELRASLVAPLPAGAHLVAVLDTCHSGSLLDLKHYRCNRVPVPWLYRGKRNSEEPRNMVGRPPPNPLSDRRTRSSSPQRSQHASQATQQNRRDLGPARLVHALFPFLHIHLDGPHTRWHRQRARPPRVLDAHVDPPDEEAHCESPVGQFPCNGWRRNLEGHSTWVAPDADDEVKADVVSLASCKDSQLAWEADGASITSSLVDLLRENSHQSLKEVFIPISHATYSLALMRHSGSQAYKHNRKAYTAILKPAKRRSIISVMCDPPASSTPSSRSSTYTSTGLTRAGTGSGPAKGPLARLRNVCASARPRAASLSLSLSIPTPAEDKENLTSGAVGPVLPAFSKLTWILPDEEAHCESPVGQFPCNGWCRNMEGHSMAPDADDEMKADVVSLASCKDSEIMWEDGDVKSMTASLVEILRRDPHPSLKDVLVHISHAMYTHTRINRHKQFLANITENISKRQRTMSLVHPDLPPTIAVSPTFPVPRKPSFAARRMDDIKPLKQLLIEYGKSEECDMDSVRNPELTSARPPDMNRHSNSTQQHYSMFDYQWKM